MFRQLALLLTDPPAPPPPDKAEVATRTVLGIHPIQLSRFLEEVWESRNPNLQDITPTGLEIPPVPQVGLERDSGIRDLVRQWVVINGTATGGTFKLKFTRAGQAPITTDAIAFSATAADVKSALVAKGVPTADVTTDGGPLPGQPVSLKFQSGLGARAITLEVVEAAVTGPGTPGPSVNIVGLYPPRLWDHLIYAYMIENTRVYEIFRRVMEEYAYGERLGFPSDESQRWLRTTEALFYRDNPPFQIYALASWIRPDIRAVRRNAYQRMFGMDLNHGTDDNRPYPYPRATAANTEFSATFEELLREVWRAIENVRNQVGANQTDVTTIANLARALFDMLRVRRQEQHVGNLARDELIHVSTMDWLHLTLSFNTPIVRDLKAEATSAAERLQKIGERVGLPAHSRSDSYFRLATRMSLILRELELGTFNDPNGAPALFQTGVFQEAMQETITHWSIATGRDVKVRPVAVTAPQPTPIRPAPRPFAPAPSSGNGRVKVAGDASSSREALEPVT
ncbi:MAG TPA: hypothetical protein VH834_18575 [Solirubrobacteraceae bacterium]|jgi:hypothetical protein